MIFKKPYAFFIKNFKLFHFILFTLSGILLYKTSSIYSFVKEYIKTTPNVIGKDLTSSLFDGYLYFLIISMLIINLLVIIIMIRKVKPYVYYIINIALYLFVIIVFAISNGVISDLEIMLVELKTLLAIRDILNISRLLETISTIFYLIRATGFDLKKFDFTRDLEELDITDEDSEEYEVSLELEGNEITRIIKRKIRQLKYYYKEYSFIINIILGLIVALTSLVIYLNIDKYSKTYKEREFMSIGNYNLGVKNSYIIENDYRKNKISNSDYDIVAVKLSIKSNTLQQLSTAKAVLAAGGYQYYHIRAYKNKLIDLGNVYNDQKISDEFVDYILVYQIPKESNNLQFKYIDSVISKHGETKVNSIDIDLTPIKIDTRDIVTNTYELGTDIDTSDSNLISYKLNISDYQINERFIETYDFCVTDDECYKFKETLKPSATNNKEKVLLKLDGNISYDGKVNDIGDVYTFIKSYGTIQYVYNGKTYVETADFNQVNFNKIKNDNVYYIEVDKDIIEATSIKLIFNIRNHQYIYVLKGEI